MGKAVALVLVAVAAALLVFALLAPRAPTTPAVPLTPPTNASHQATTPVASSSTSGNRTSASYAAVDAGTAVAPPSVGTGPNTPIEPPRSAEQRASDQLEARRAPFYDRLHREIGPELVSAGPSQEDPATLDLYTARDTDQIVTWLVDLAVRPDAYKYGFNHVRFFLPNPSHEVERYRFDSEATYSSSGVWHTFRK